MRTSRVSDVPMGPRPAATTKTKEVNYLPQSKKKRSSQKASDESGPDEQSGDQPEPESQVQQSGDQPEAQPSEEEFDQPKPDAQSSEEESDQPKPSAQAQSSEEETSDDQPKPEPTKQEEPEQPTVADVLKEREETVRLHNEHTGGGDVHEGELQNQLDEHNQRVGDASR
jgi:hypothetical protein